MNLLWMKWIVWSRFPFSIFKIHYFSFGMRIPATSCKRFPKILCQVVNPYVFESAWLCYLDRISIKSEFKMNFNLQANISNLQMTFSYRNRSKAKKYFLHFKLISVAGTRIKIKFQCPDSFDIAPINSTYLNKLFKITVLIFERLFCKWLTCLFSFHPPIIQCCPFKVAPHEFPTRVLFSKLNLRSPLRFPKWVL